MSIESAKAYVERLKTDRGFAAAADAVKTEEQASAFIAEHGFDFTSAEFAAAVPRELAARELEAAVGGEPEGSPQRPMQCPKCLLSVVMLTMQMP